MRSGWTASWVRRCPARTALLFNLINHLIEDSTHKISTVFPSHWQQSPRPSIQLPETTDAGHTFCFKSDGGSLFHKEWIWWCLAAQWWRWHCTSAGQTRGYPSWVQDTCTYSFVELKYCECRRRLAWINCVTDGTGTSWGGCRSRGPGWGWQKLSGWQPGQLCGHFSAWNGWQTLVPWREKLVTL